MRRTVDPPRASDRRRWAAAVFVVLAAAWAALNGTDGWPVGLGVAALGAAAGATLAPGEPTRWRPWLAVGFVAYFLRESVRGGLDVARRAFHPRLPLSPRFVDRPLGLPPGPARTLMVSLVSLVPGSLSADLDPQRGVLRVHLLAAGSDAGLDELESRIAALFGLGAGAR